MNNNPFRISGSAQTPGSAWGGGGLGSNNLATQFDPYAPYPSQQQQLQQQQLQQQQAMSSNPYNRSFGAPMGGTGIQVQPTGSGLYGGLGGNGYGSSGGFGGASLQPQPTGLQQRQLTGLGGAGLASPYNQTNSFLSQPLSGPTLAQNFPQSTGGYSQSQPLSSPYGSGLSVQHTGFTGLELGMQQQGGNPYLASGSMYGSQPQQLIPQSTGYPMVGTGRALYGETPQQQTNLMSPGLANPLLLQGQNMSPVQATGYTPNSNTNFLLMQQQLLQQQQQQQQQRQQQQHQQQQQQRSQQQRPLPPKPDDKVRVTRCPVCDASIEGDEPALNHHVNEHFLYGGGESTRRVTREEPPAQLEPVNDLDYVKKLYQEENRLVNERRFRYRE